MHYIGNALLLFMQAFMLFLAAGGIGAELGTLLKRATQTLNLPQLHRLAIAAESWLMVAALIVWAVSVLILIVGAIKRRSVDGPPSHEMGAFGPIMLFLLVGLAIGFIGGAGLVVAGAVHIFASEDVADVVGLVVVAGLVGWVVGVTKSTPTSSKKA